MDLKQYGKVSQLIFWLQKILSNRVDKIIANSNASIKFHKDCGFYMAKSVVIHNGIDTNKFKKDEIKRKIFRGKYDLKETDIAIGIVARIDYMKGYIVFSKVAKKILDNYDNICFFSVGGGDEKIKQECYNILNNYNEKRFFWLGNQNNVEDIYSGLDISSSSSFGEGFSNAIAEAMSCEIVCVVTDVGDSSMIVEDVGIVVNSNDEQSLYNGLINIVNSNYRSLGIKSRDKIEDNFSLLKMLQNTQREIYGLAK